jgi:ABC-type phosphate transport system substrate-binding protein
MNKLVIGALLALALGTVARADGYKVVVNAANPAKKLSKAQVSAYFLKRSTAWDAGGTVQPVDLPDGPVREKFCAEVLGKSAAAVKAYWTRLTFAGRDTPPAAKASDDEVLAFVRGNPGAIGYVSDAAGTSGVAVVTLSE